jgi:hypothetical protein
MEALGPQMKECLVPLVDAIRQACGTSGISCPESRQTVTSAGVSDIPIKTMLIVLSLFNWLLECLCLIQCCNCELLLELFMFIGAPLFNVCFKTS